jgi:hypothetical protein
VFDVVVFDVRSVTPAFTPVISPIGTRERAGSPFVTSHCSANALVWHQRRTLRLWASGLAGVRRRIQRQSIAYPHDTRLGS